MQAGAVSQLWTLLPDEPDILDLHVPVAVQGKVDILCNHPNDHDLIEKQIGNPPKTITFIKYFFPADPDKKEFKPL